MALVPVIDLWRGRVVHAVGGQRAEYRDVKSRLGPARPAEMARALVERLGADTLYVADLDAILDQRPAWDDYAAVLDSGASIWLDCGLHSAQDLHSRLLDLMDRGVEALVAGLETLSSPEALAQIGRRIGWDRVIFSVDMKRGEVLAGAGWPQRRPETVAHAARRVGCRRFLLLDLAGVGMEEGCPALELCRRLASELPEVEIISGGGVRGWDDAQMLHEAGVEAVLVGTAFHRGTLTSEHVQRAKRWRRNAG